MRIKPKMTKWDKKCPDRNAWNRANRFSRFRRAQRIAFLKTLPAGVSYARKAPEEIA